MFKNVHAFSGFSVDDLDAARRFYGETLGLDVKEEHGMLTLRLGSGADVLVYAKGPAHEPASFTILNFPVRNIDAAVDALAAKGVAFEHYDNADIKTDAKGIARDGYGPPIAWFKDPAGNFISVLEDKR
jgi:catechol 2,3-dioxygenase-like lactoylglutathione lyase family enzyme